MDLAKELILAVKKNNSHGGYGMQKECEALIGHVLNNMAKSKIPTLKADVKNDEDANRFREEGNQCFVMGDDDDAIEKYTISLAYSKTKESMALAVANRSAALYRKQLYRECLIDIDAALSYGYPEDKRKKLKERAQKSVECLRQLYQAKDQNMNNLPSTNAKGDIVKNNDNISLVKEFIDDKSESKNKIENIEDSVDELISKIPIATPRYVVDERELTIAHGSSNEAPALSSGVRIAYSEKYGRHTIATKQFKPGCIVSMEYPFAYVIYKDKWYTHCHHCLSRSFNLIPCPNCPIAQYCSEKCKTAAWEMAHQIECPVQAVLSKLLNVDEDKIRILTKIFRLLIISTKNGKAIDDLCKDSQIAERNSDNRTAGFTDAGIFDSSSARSALSLSTNLTTRPFLDISAFACISALAVVILAIQSNFFGKKYRSGELNALVQRADVRFSGTLLFRHCLIVSSNSFSVQHEPSVKVGSGLYTTTSLMNHSCSPNTFRHFDGLMMITRALEPIKEGDQIFTCYGGGYQFMPRMERKKKMMLEYFFDCTCRACLEDWPTYTEILRNHIGSIAKTNKNLVETLKPFRQRLLVNKYDIDSVKSVLDILYTEAKMPCEEIVHAVQYLKCYYLDP